MCTRNSCKCEKLVQGASPGGVRGGAPQSDFFRFSHAKLTKLAQRAKLIPTILEMPRVLNMTLRMRWQRNRYHKIFFMILKETPFQQRRGKHSSGPSDRTKWLLLEFPPRHDSGAADSATGETGREMNPPRSGGLRYSRRG